MSEPKQHAKFAASSSDRWLSCPGSVQASEAAPPQRDSAASEEGTRAHELMEVALNTNVKNVVDFFEREEDKYPPEMRKHVQGFVDYVRSLLKPNDELLVEERVELDGVITEDKDPVFPVAFGTVDVAIVEPFGVLHIIDFKYGRHHVPHEDNSQMIYYALGLAHKLKYDFESVRTTIYQPRLGTKKHPARSADYSIEELLKWKKVFAEGIKECEKPKPKFHPGEHCFFCPAKITCPMIYKKSLEAAALDFNSPVQPDPKHLTSDQLRTILSKAYYLKLWISEVEKYAEDRLKDGQKIPGWTLEPKRASRRWAEGVTLPEDLFEKVPVSPARAGGVLIESGWEVSEIEEFLNASVVSESSGMKLAQTTKDFDGQGLDDLAVD